METNIKALSEISKAMKQETSALANMAKSNYSDAKTLKTLSLIARMYLPASLVIVSVLCDVRDLRYVLT